MSISRLPLLLVRSVRCWSRAYDVALATLQVGAPCLDPARPQAVKRYPVDTPREGSDADARQPLQGKHIIQEGTSLLVLCGRGAH